MDHALAEMFLSEGVQPVCCIQVFGEMGRLKLGISGFAHVVFRKLAISAHSATEQSPAKSAIGERSNPVVKSVRQDVVLDFTFEEVIRRLNCVKGCSRLELLDLLGGMVADADGPYLAPFVELTKSGGRLFDGGLRIRPMDLINIDVVGLQAPQ